MQEKKPKLASFVLIGLVLALFFACAVSVAGVCDREDGAEESKNPHQAEKDNVAESNVDVTASSTTCNSCSDCTNKLNGEYDTVKLTRDLINVKGSCITFGANNVVFDGNGHKIDGDDTGEFESGITMSSKSGNTIKNCVITDFESGITLYGSSKNKIYDNEVSSNYYDGIWISTNSDSNNIHDNLIENNGNYGIYFSSDSNNNIFSKNVVCSNPTDIHDDDKNSGDENTCDTTSNWNDYGTTGCTYSCPEEKPDLLITKIQCDSENHRIGYKIKNVGAATASKGHYTTLFVDGAYKIKEQVNVDLAPGAVSQRYFDYYSWQCTPPRDNAKVCADYGDFVDESNEQNNCREETCQCAPSEKSDLVITDIWNEDGTICYQVRNIGNATAPKGHYTALSIDGEPRVNDMVEVELAPKERLKQCFNYGWQCSPPDDTITVCADYKDVVNEADETNNCRNETWKCDNTPPVIVSGPVVSEVTQSSVAISWTTNEDSDSLVRFGRTAGKYEDQKTSLKMKQEHKVILKDLLPSTTYRYVVESTDASENTVVSRDGLFETSPLPDDEPPVVHSLDITRGKGDFLYYEMSADATDNIGVERVEFYIDDMLIGTDYSAPYQSYMTPASIGMAWAEFFEEHTVAAVAFDDCRVEARLPALFDPPYECEDIDLDMRDPRSEYTIYIEGDTVPAGTIVPIVVYAARVQNGSCVLGDCEPRRVSPISQMEFYVNLAPIPHTSSFLVHTGNWDASGLPPGTYAIRVDAIASEGCKQTIIRYVEIEHGEPRLNVSREVTRIGNYFRVALTVENLGTVNAVFDRIEDNVDGFQPIEKSTAEYDVITECSDDGRHCDIEIDLPGSSFTLGLDERISMEYLVVPIEFPGPGTPVYAIGADPVRVMDYGEIDPPSFDSPCIHTSDDYTLSSEVDTAIETSDYLIVTNPDRLFDQFPRAEADSVLSAMADLAQTRRGILGYPSGPGSDDPIWVSDCIRMWGSAMRGSDGTENNYMSNGYLLIVGETEIIPSWTVDIPDMDWSGDKTTTEVPFSDLPYADVLGNDNVPELITGRIIGNEASDLIRPIEVSMEVAGGTGFDRSFGMVTSGSEGEWEGFVPSAYDVQVVLHDQMHDGASALHWSLWVHKDETSMVMGYHLPITGNDGFLLADVDGDGASEAIVVDDSTNLASVYEYSDLGWELSTASDSFQCRFTPYDGLASGDIDSDGEDEIIVGTDEWDKIAIFNDFPRHTSDNVQFPEFSIDFDPWDVIASGDLWGDGEDEIILASTDDYGTIYIYSYYVPESGGPYPELRLRDTLEYVSFTAYDGFAVGNVAGDAKDEIIVANDVTDRIYIYNAAGTKIGELEADPFTHYDGLAVGDVDGDGMDEIAIIIDDEIDEKRRLFVYEDDSWYYNATEEEWKIRRGGVHKIYSRYIDFHGIRYTASDTRHDGFAIGDIHGDGEAEIGVALEGGDKLYILDGHYPDGWKDRYMPIIRGDAPDIDIFTVRGHGNPTGCSPFETRDIASFDFSAHPLVFALTCLSGNYEGDWWWIKSGSPDIHTDGDNGFAEAFFDSGAGVYIGATHVSSSSHNNQAGSAFFEEWGPDETAGEAFTQYERDRAGTGDNWWRYWVTEYNYYGDPKFGALGGAGWAAFMAHAVKHGSPPSTLKVSIPEYEVNTTAGEDYVDIPGGDVLLEDGKNRVPYYVVEVDCPAGYKVQEVVLVEKSKLSTTEGLNLPITVMRIDSLGSSLNAKANSNGEEWYPTKDFDWRVIPNGDGSSTLVLMIYPFFYNQLTTQVRFYQDYCFDINHTVSSVTITDLVTDKYAYQQGDTVMVDMWLNNSGEAQDVIVDALVKRCGSDEIGDGLLLRTLKGFEGLASFSPQWDSSGVEPGYYYVEVTLKDTSGNVLDRQTEMFRLGISSGEITNFTATLEYFEIGDDIEINMTFNNTGTVNITGTAITRIMNSSGYVVEEFRHNVTDLMPSESIGFDDTWDTSGAEEGSYKILGYVLYDSKATSPATVIVTTVPLEKKPDLEIVKKWENWVDKEKGTYTVSYVVHNNGTTVAPAGHHTTLYIDEEPVEHKPVPVTLKPCDTYEDTFKTVVKCTPLGDKIMVCADNYDKVEELDEGNNCMTNVWQCPVPVRKPDLVIKDIKLSREGDYCYVDYLISNTGTVSASASTTYLYVDGKKVASDSTSALASGASRWERFTAYRTTGAHTYEVCADGPNAISETNEANNCRKEELTCPLRLDIYFADGGESPGSVYHYNTTTGIEETVYTRPSRRLYSFTFHQHIPEKLYFVNANENKIYRTLQTSSGWTPEEVVYTHTTYVRDIAFAFGKDGELRLYFSEATGAGEKGKIYKIEDGKAYLYYEVKLADVGGFWSGDFAFDDRGNLYLSSGNHIPASIYKVEEGEVKEIFKDEKECISGLIYADGTLYYANWGTRLYRLDISTKERTVVYSNTKRTWLSDVDFRPELIG